jgi:hypothetical protein
MAPGGMLSFRKIIVITEPSSWFPFLIDLFQPLVNINWLELVLDPGHALGSVGELEGNLSYSFVI